MNCEMQLLALGDDWRQWRHNSGDYGAPATGVGQTVAIASIADRKFDTKKLVN